MGTIIKYILLFKYIYFVWVKITSERDVFILAGAMLKVMCILHIFQSSVAVHKENSHWICNTNQILDWNGFNRVLKVIIGLGIVASLKENSLSQIQIFISSNFSFCGNYFQQRPFLVKWAHFLKSFLWHG